MIYIVNKSNKPDFNISLEEYCFKNLTQYGKIFILWINEPSILSLIHISFTISNLGMYGVDEFTAIINQPNSAILSVSSTQQRAVPRDGEIVIRPIMKISLTADHRVIDGLTGAKFMTDLKAALEDPLTLFV